MKHLVSWVMETESVFYPQEVETLMWLKTVAVACGVWHTAHVVEVIVLWHDSSDTNY